MGTPTIRPGIDGIWGCEQCRPGAGIHAPSNAREEPGSTSVIAEYIFNGRGPLRENSIMDGSAAVTGLLMAMTLPPGLPVWMAFLGGVVAIVLGKILFGGLGMNVFNPSLTGRAFLQASFPVLIFNSLFLNFQNMCSCISF